MLAVDLPPVGASATEARRLVRDRLVGVLTPDDVEVVALLVTELVGNAVIHAGTDVRLTVSTRPTETAGLSALGGTEVLVEVHDASPQLPVRRDASPDVPHGRGLQLVEHLARSWGAHPTSSGKVVWCLVAVTPL